MAVGGVRIEWNGDALVGNVRAALAKGLTAGAVVVQNAMKKNLSVKGGAKGKHGFHSPLGAFPFQQTGNLRRSISHQAANPADLVAAAGVSAGASAAFKGESIDTYALYLEFKPETIGGGGRPFLIRSLRENQNRVRETVIAVARNQLKVGAK